MELFIVKLRSNGRKGKNEFLIFKWYIFVANFCSLFSFCFHKEQLQNISCFVRPRFVSLTKFWAVGKFMTASESKIVKKHKIFWQQNFH